MMVKNKKILITGVTGLLGLSLVRNKPAGVDIYGAHYKFPDDGFFRRLDILKHLLFDVRDKKEVDAAFRDVIPDVVIHAASLGNVDYCEKNQKEAWQVNVEGSGNIIEACKKNGSKAVFMSSNAVFDGKKPPYSETDAPNPVDYYGMTKLQTEKDIAAAGGDYAIVRLMTMYGWNHPAERQNPVTWLLEKLAKGEKVNIVSDIYNNHLFVDNASQAIWAIVLKEAQGIYNIAGGEIKSRYELAASVAAVFGFDKGLITPVESSFFKSIAPRPKNTSYNIKKMETNLLVRGIGVLEGLAMMKANPPKEWEYEWYKKSGIGI